MQYSQCTQMNLKKYLRKRGERTFINSCEKCFIHLFTCVCIYTCIGAEVPRGAKLRFDSGGESESNSDDTESGFMIG